jgi:hypothetical protein
MKDKGYEHKAKSKDFLEALINNIAYCRLLQKEQMQATYSKLLDWLVSYEPESNNNGMEFPDLKEVYKLAGIPYSHIGTDLRDIYYAIYKLNLNEPRKFVMRDQRIFKIEFNYFETRADFLLGLDIVPRIGESFVFSFIEPIIGISSFYVKNITHEIFDWGSVVVIKLTPELPNLYLQLLTEKAFLNEEINMYEYSGITKYDITEKLLKLYKNL